MRRFLPLRPFEAASLAFALSSIDLCDSSPGARALARGGRADGRPKAAPPSAIVAAVLASRLRRLGAFALVVALFVACTRQRPSRIAPSLASSAAAEADFAPIRKSWEARALDRARLERFLALYPEDGLAPLARTYLVFVHVDSGDALAAQRALDTLDGARPGAIRDLATVARARFLRLRDRPRDALELLRPLAGKIIDVTDREIFLEEIALSSVASHDDYEAIGYLDAWVEGVSEDDRPAIRERVAAVVASLPRPVLEATYRAMRPESAGAGYGPEIRRMVAARLAQIAVESDDSTLARWLLDTSGVSAHAAAGDAGVELGELATSRRGLDRVVGRTVALVLPTSREELRDEAADVVRGVAWALDLPRRPGRANDGVRLVTRDQGADDASLVRALEEIVGEGASVIIAGVDRPSAERALAWGEARGVAVIALTAPRPGYGPRHAGVVVGEPVAAELELLGRELARRGASPSSLVTHARDAFAYEEVRALDRVGAGLVSSVSCDVTSAVAGQPRFPVDGWAATKIRGFIVAGGEGCARDVVREVEAELRRPFTVALTLQAGAELTVHEEATHVFGVGAGLLPILAREARDVQDADVRAFMESYGAHPTYFVSLARDAGALARAAMQVLPNDETSTPMAVLQRRAAVAQALGASKLRLWTSDATGVTSARHVARALRIVDWPSPARRSAAPR